MVRMVRIRYQVQCRIDHDSAGYKMSFLVPPWFSSMVRTLLQLLVPRLAHKHVRYFVFGIVMCVCSFVFAWIEVLIQQFRVVRMSTRTFVGLLTCNATSSSPNRSQATKGMLQGRSLFILTAYRKHSIHLVAIGEYGRLVETI